ncbi:hypothetical protein PR048_002818 [Dryococelus australis]|uniref:Uncharacterized protein n=1 Tax=Dryococelus australis TaxID=614101 RepID=A0ABQ9ILV8_9NEOP|nr:hypothetical protein PR048_002818 [Dryococelus australis]
MRLMAEPHMPRQAGKFLTTRAHAQSTRTESLKLRTAGPIYTRLTRQARGLAVCGERGVQARRERERVEETSPHVPGTGGVNGDVKRSGLQSSSRRQHSGQTTLAWKAPCGVYDVMDLFKRGLWRVNDVARGARGSCANCALYTLELEPLEIFSPKWNLCQLTDTMFAGLITDSDMLLFTGVPISKTAPGVRNFTHQRAQQVAYHEGEWNWHIMSRPPVSLLAYHQGEPGSVPSQVTPGLSHVGIMPDYVTGQLFFLGDLPFPPPFHSGAAPNSPQSSSSCSLVVRRSASQEVGRVALAFRRLRTPGRMARRTLKSYPASPAATIGTSCRRCLAPSRVSKSTTNLTMLFTASQNSSNPFSPSQQALIVALPWGQFLLNTRIAQYFSYGNYKLRYNGTIYCDPCDSNGMRDNCDAMYRPGIVCGEDPSYSIVHSRPTRCPLISPYFTGLIAQGHWARGSRTRQAGSMAHSCLHRADGVSWGPRLAAAPSAAALYARQFRVTELPLFYSYSGCDNMSFLVWHANLKVGMHGYLTLGFDATPVPRPTSGRASCPNVLTLWKMGAESEILTEIDLLTLCWTLPPIGVQGFNLLINRMAHYVKSHAKWAIVQRFYPHSHTRNKVWKGVTKDVKYNILQTRQRTSGQRRHTGFSGVAALCWRERASGHKTIGYQGGQTRSLQVCNQHASMQRGRAASPRLGFDAAHRRGGRTRSLHLHIQHAGIQRGGAAFTMVGFDTANIAVLRCLGGGAVGFPLGRPASSCVLLAVVADAPRFRWVP